MFDIEVDPHALREAGTSMVAVEQSVTELDVTGCLVGVGQGMPDSGSVGVADAVSVGWSQDVHDWATAIGTFATALHESAQHYVRSDHAAASGLHAAASSAGGAMVAGAGAGARGPASPHLDMGQR